MGRKDVWSVGTGFGSRRWLSWDACGILGVSLSWFVHIYALVVISWKLLSHSPLSAVIFVVAYIPAAVLAMVSLAKASLTDPGAVPMGARPLVTVRRASSINEKDESQDSAILQSGRTARRRRGVRRCHKCQDNYKPPRAHHDSVTGRCIVKFDHFCPWVNNAVGAKNHKFFCLFLFYTAITCLISLLLLLIRIIQCGFVYDDENEEQQSQVTSNGYEGPGAELSEAAEATSGTRYVLEECNDFFGGQSMMNYWILGLLVASLVFLIFTCSMGCEQLEAIETGKGKIARMKMRVGHSGTEFAQVTEEFNEMFGGETGPKPALHWFLPTTVVFPQGMEKVVLGYEWDDTFDSVPFVQDNTTETGRASSGAAADSDQLGESSDDVRSQEMASLSQHSSSPQQQAGSSQERGRLPARESDASLEGCASSTKSSSSSVKNRRSHGRSPDSGEQSSMIV